MFAILRLIDLAVDVYILLILIYAFLTWIPNIGYNYRSLMQWLERVTNPVLKPCQRILPPEKTGGFDISPIIAIIGIRLIWRILLSIIFAF